MIETSIDYLEDILVKGGPDVSDYAAVLSTFDAIHRHEFAMQRGVSSRTQKSNALETFLSRHRKTFRSTSTMQGFAYAKPHGYSGDFEIIERIYHYTQSGVVGLKNWDLFFHEGSAPKAVRNRSSVLARTIDELKPENVMSVGCGPALDVSAAILETKLFPRLSFIDNDINAIARAKVNLSIHAEDGNPAVFYHRNALRFRTEDRFDLIWSSGLFDYLNDKTAAFLLKRFRLLLRSGGTIMVGNFSNFNPSRSYMELVGEWFLIHRGYEDLMNLAVDAGFKRSKIRIIEDETRVGLFLIAQG